MGAVKEYKCLNCKAGLKFHPPSQKWKCDYCYSSFIKEELGESGLEEQLSNEDVPELDMYNCTSCGAELITQQTTSATFCLYCKNPTIIKTRFSGRFKPEYVIPFKITKDESKEIYKKWIRKRFFAPRDFKSKEEIDKVTGLYAPYWLFDSNANGGISAEGTKVSSWSSGSYRYTKTKYYNVSRQGESIYKKIPVDGSKKLDDKIMEMIEPYKYEDLTNFSLEYMSGFMAEKYDVDGDKATVVMKDRVEKFLEERLRETANGYSSLRVREKDVNLTNTSQSYAMLPIYLLVNTFKGKEHIFIINGQTGKVAGDTPTDRKKQVLFATGLFFGTWALAVFGGALFA